MDSEWSVVRPEGKTTSPLTRSIEQSVFGKTADGREIGLYTITNKNGLKAAMTNYGAILVSLEVPDRDGKLDDVVLGYDSLAGYLGDVWFMGGTIGRFGNRIARGQFSLDGRTYRLAQNNGEHHLHGGTHGFHTKVWQAKVVEGPESPAVRFGYLSEDGEEGYPGTLSVEVTYALSDQNELTIDYAAETDQKTVVNLTNHSYFNLAGASAGDILDHQLMIQAKLYTPVDAGSIPTGKLESVAGTPFDFGSETLIGSRIGEDTEQLRFGQGYDHNWVLTREGKARSLAARVREEKTGREMEVWTTEPGLQFYSGNFLDGTIRGKGGKTYGRRSGFCLETQHFPDSPNHPDFPSAVLKPGDRYLSSTTYRF